MARIINTFSVVYTYLGENIQERLNAFSKKGYKLVSTEIVNDDNHRKIYLFFTKEVDE